jgi:hypothetical protein
MLVQNGFADPRAIGDFVHPGRVVAVVDEDVAGDDEQLAPTLVAGPPVAAAIRGSGALRRPTAVGRCAGPTFGCLGEIAHRVLI